MGNLAVDILKFHAVYWPAILLALKIDLPKQLNIHGFFNINGQKMSKTLGNVVSPNELVEKYGAEATKYLILSQFSFGSESDIKVEEFTGLAFILILKNIFRFTRFWCD